MLTEGSKDSGVEVMCEGRHLGAAVGIESFKTSFIKKKVDNWIKSVVKLADIAKTQPHAAFSTSTHSGLSWLEPCRTQPTSRECNSGIILAELAETRNQ